MWQRQRDRERWLLYYTVFDSLLCWSAMSCTYFLVTPLSFFPTLLSLFFLSLFLFFKRVLTETMDIFKQAQQHESPLTPVTLCWVSAFVQSNQGVFSLSSNHRHWACTADAGGGVVCTEADVFITLLSRYSTWARWGRKTERRESLITFSCD